MMTKKTVRRFSKIVFSSKSVDQIVHHGVKTVKCVVKRRSRSPVLNDDKQDLGYVLKGQKNDRDHEKMTEINPQNE